MKVTKRELDILQLMWQTDKSLMISEIVQKDKTGACTIYSVQRIVKNLVEKGLVEVDGFAQNKKVIGRTFRPLIQSEDIELDIINDRLQDLVHKFSTTHLVAALLPKDNTDENAEKILDELEEMIQERKKELKNKN